MSEAYAKEAEQWYKESMYYLKDLPDGKFKDKMKEAVLRNKNKIIEIGYAVFMAEFYAECVRRQRQAFIEDSKERAKLLLEKAEETDLNPEEHGFIMGADKDTKATYMNIRLKRSGLGRKFFDRTFASFRADGNNDKALVACLEIAQGERTKGVILKGDNGIGKTHLAAAVVNWWAGEGRRVYFGNMVQMVKKVMNNFSTGTEKIIERFLDCDLLVLDDLGAEHWKKDSTWVVDFLYEILNAAYEDNKIIIVTTRLPELDLMERYGKDINSRLAEMCDYIEYTGKDRRFEPAGEATPFDYNPPYKD